ncbi:MAG: hypothetical protein J0I77_17940 [Rudaea sp.]|uniref:hypothetical protein n=1 Tax=unclassified Rudaea TaxID=2627037 RepID=UPI0010F8E756|nr:MULTISPECIES: hypothetical protein [unclassified Rudaea]MBN8887611.1 hypothetical protein [Rudaea sp.]
MRGDKTAIEQLTYGPIGMSVTWGAWLDGKQITQMNGCPGGYAVRWLWLDWQDPHATTIHADRDAAIEYIRLWVSGLDIDPGDIEGCELSSLDDLPAA